MPVRRLVALTVRTSELMACDALSRIGGRIP